jgi:hypothetical protein
MAPCQQRTRALDLTEQAIDDFKQIKTSWDAA